MFERSAEFGWPTRSIRSAASDEAADLREREPHYTSHRSAAAKPEKK